MNLWWSPFWVNLRSPTLLKNSSITSVFVRLSRNLLEQLHFRTLVSKYFWMNSLSKQTKWKGSHNYFHHVVLLIQASTKRNSIYDIGKTHNVKGHTRSIKYPYRRRDWIFIVADMHMNYRFTIGNENLFSFVHIHCKHFILPYEFLISIHNYKNRPILGNFR